MAHEVNFECDGKEQRVAVDDPGMPLLYALTDLLGLKNPRYGCGVAQCGACTVQLDGVPIKSCVTPVSAVEGRKVLTIAGLGTPKQPHPLQTAFVDAQATQCGYCINGFMMTAVAIVRDNPTASREEIRSGLSGLKCRCGSHMSILRAIESVTGADT